MRDHSSLIAQIVGEAVEHGIPLDIAQFYITKAFFAGMTIISAPKSKRERKEKPAEYTDKFDRFWKNYPRDPLMSKKEAAVAFAKLDDTDQEKAIKSLPAFKSYIEKQKDYRTIHACRYLKYRRFDAFAELIEEEEKFNEENIWIAIGSSQWRAWDDYERRVNGRGIIHGTYTKGCYRKSEWPPQ